jgi:DtxR family Mn-dependent transcriptional regulator
MPSSTIEDYLKCIYQEGKRLGERLVPTGQIAASLQVAPGTATSMVKTLAESGLLVHEPYAGVRLTEAGQRLALHVLRRHRLVELFLVEVMGMDWSLVHEDAERLEHVVSDRIIERMDEMLGRPTLDPHGDPIPDARGAIEEPDHPSLLTCQADRPHRVARVADQEEAFLQLLESYALVPGRQVTVLSRSEKADSIRLRTEILAEVSLGYRAASKVLVEEDRPER